MKGKKMRRKQTKEEEKILRHKGQREECKGARKGNHNEGNEAKEDTIEVT